MNRMLKGFFSLALLTCGAIVADNNTSTCLGNPYFSIRSQSVNAARELAGWQQDINLFDRDCLYGSFTITPEYTRSFRPGRIAEFLFGSDLQTVNNEDGTLVIAGSQVANRGAKDWLGDYFGLPTDFRSVVTFKPRISNFLVDFNLYLGLDEWAEGLYFRIHAPVVYTRWELRATEQVTTPGVNGYANGYMNALDLNTGTGQPQVGVARSALRNSWLATMDGTYKFGDMQNPLQFGKISSGTTDNTTTTAHSKHTKTRLSDLEAALGWNFWQCEDYHFGLQLRGSAPCGNTPNGEYLFEATVGNGHHWTLGGGISSHAVLWRGCDEDRYFAVYMDANITHLFKTKQTRSFNFVGKPNSRYMLLEEMKSPAVGLFAGAAAPAVAPNAQYNKNLLPAINVTTLDVNVSIAVQGDFVLKFAYISGCFEADLGYNLWGRSGEKFSLKNEPAITANKYAFKGTANVYGFNTAAGGTVSGVALSATASKSDIHGGQLTDANATTISSINTGVDNQALAWINAAAGMNDALANANAAQTNTSSTAVFVKAADLDLSKSPSALSNKIFGSLTYHWNDCECWIPFLSLGAEVEFGSSRSNDCYAAVSQWGVWLKGGLSYN